MLRTMRSGLWARFVPAGLISLAAACALVGPRADGSGTATTIPLHTVPGARLPVIEVLQRSAGTRSAYVFVAEKKGGSTGGPMIVDSHGRVVWYHQLRPAAPGHRFSGPALPGQAGADLVAGNRERRRHREGRLPDLRHVVPARRDRPGGQRASGRPARVPADPTRHRVHHGLPRGPGRPEQHRRAEAGLRGRQRRSGDRRRDRPSRIRVAQHRSRAVHRVDPGEPRAGPNREPEAAHRLLPCQLGRRRSRRDDPDLGPQRVDHLSPRPRRTHRVAARRQAERLRPGSRRPVCLPAQRAPAREAAQPVRQRRHPPGRALLPTARAAARRPGQARDDRPDLPATEEDRVAVRGEPGPAPRRRRARRVGRRPAGERVRAGRPTSSCS